jgi:hypothetical protein
MALVMNATSREVQVKIHGSWFTFKPEQIKEMHDGKAFHLASTCAYMGFVMVPDEFSDLDYKASKAGKEKLAELKAQGISNRVQYLEMLKDNELVSLKKDLDQKNLKIDPLTFMSKGMEENLKELATYKKASSQVEAERVARIKESLDALEE